MCANLNRNAMRFGFDLRLAIEVKSMHAHDVRDVEAVAENHVGVAGDALHRKAQHVRAILGLRHRQVVCRRIARPHPRDAPPFAQGIGRDARAVPMMIATTWADRRVLSGLEFRPNFVASDAIFARYAKLVEGLPEWSSSC